MKQRFLFLLLFLTYSTTAIAQLNLDNLAQHLELEYSKSKCLFSYPLDTTAPTYYLQVTPAILDTSEVLIDKGYMINLFKKNAHDAVFSFENSSVAINPNEKLKKRLAQLNAPEPFQILFKKRYTYLKLNKKYLNCLSKYQFNTGKSFCIVPSIAKYISIYKKEVTNGDSIAYDVKEQMITVVTLIQDAKVKIYSSQDEIDENLPVYTIKGGKWSDWKNYTCYPRYNGYRTVDIKKIKIRLLELGYKDIVINNDLDEITKDALYSFQYENGIPMGDFSNKTFIVLFEELKF